MRGDHNQPLPPELDWDNMKEGIFDKIHAMEQEEDSQPHKANTFSRKRIGFFLILMYVLMLGLFYISPNMMYEADQPTQDQDVVLLPESNPNLNTSIEASCEPLNTRSQTKAADTTLGADHLQVNTTKHHHTDKSVSPNQSSKQSANVFIWIDQVPTYERRYQIAASDKLQATYANKTVHDSLTIATNELSPLVTTSPSSSRPNQPLLQALPSYQLGTTKLAEMSHPMVDLPQVANTYLPAILRRKSPDQLTLAGGITFWRPGYGDTQPERAPYETSLLSFQLQGHYTKRFNKDYFVMAGLQYQQLESRFEYNATIEDYKVILEDTIIQVRNNLITGAQNVIRGDVAQSVEAERSVRHHNQSKLFKLSLGIGKSWRVRAFQTDLYLGGALNSLAQHEGRTLVNDAIIDYSGSSSPLFDKQFTAEGMLGVRLHYFLTQQIGVTTGIQAQRSLMNWSNQEAGHQYPVSYSLQMGLSYAVW